MSQQNNTQWNHGLFSVTSAGFGTCIKTCFCPCVQYADNVRTLGHGEFLQNCLLFCLCAPCAPCISAGPKRTEMRNAYQLEEVCFGDCITTCLCGCCSIIQIAAEIDTRGVPQGGPTGQQMA